MSFSISSDTGKGFAETFKFLEAASPKQFKYASKVAINKVAEDVRFVLQNEMIRVFDRPTQYTINSLFIRYARLETQEAFVSFKQAGSSNAGSAGRYLLSEVYGGAREAKRSERTLEALGFKGAGDLFLTPASGAKLDANGNVPRRKWEEVIAFFKANRGDAFSSTSKSGKRLSERAQLGNINQYFMVAPNDPRAQSRRLSPGIYERKGLSFAKLFSITKRPVYKKRFDFFGVGQQVARDQFAKRFIESFEYAQRTAK